MSQTKSGKDVWDADNIGIFGYGSLLTDPGPDLGPHIVDRITQESPWPVEYARRSESRGGSATLVRHPKGAKIEVGATSSTSADWLDLLQARIPYAED